jgi:hypothetical protein
VAALFLRWGPPLIGVIFAAGLQLSDATQHPIGWALVALAVIGSVLYVFLERRQVKLRAKRRRRRAWEAEQRRKQRFSKYAYLMTDAQKAELLPKRKAQRRKQ